MNDTARMAKCLKITDPRALTLAYKMPLAGMDCEWGLHVGGGPCSWREQEVRGLRASGPQAWPLHQLAGVPPPCRASGPQPVPGGGHFFLLPSAGHVPFEKLMNICPPPKNAHAQSH